MPAGLRLALAKAEGTKNIGDDLTALRAMVAYLQKLLPKTKDIEKRIEITEALNGLRSRISELGKTENKTDILAPPTSKHESQVAGRVPDGIRQAQDRIRDARAASTPRSASCPTAAQVFDAKTQKMLDNMRVTVRRVRVHDRGGEETPTERLIRERREQRNDAGLAVARAKPKTPRKSLRRTRRSRNDGWKCKRRKNGKPRTSARGRTEIEEERGAAAGVHGRARGPRNEWKTNATTAKRPRNCTS